MKQKSILQMAFFLCEEKQAIQTSNDIREAHEAFYKAILKGFK